MRRVFLAGGSGVIGVRLIPLLVGAGHVVAGMTRSAGKADALRSLGAEPVVCDVFDAASLREAMLAFRPDIVLHQLTDLPDDRARIPELGAANNRMRREGTANLLAAAGAAGAGRRPARRRTAARCGHAPPPRARRRLARAPGIVSGPATRMSGATRLSVADPAATPTTPPQRPATTMSRRPATDDPPDRADARFRRSLRTGR